MKPSKELSRPVEVETKALLGCTLISYEEFINLEIDDVLILDQAIEDSIPLFLEGNKKYKGLPGVYEEKRALKIEGESNE